MLQQAIELMLKGLVEAYGREPAYGHLYSNNVEILKSLYSEVPQLREIDEILELANEKAYLYISWETKSRYSHFHATEKI